MPDYAYSVFSALGVVLCFEPVVYTLRERKPRMRSLAGGLLIGWIGLYNLLSFADSIVWGGNTGDDISGWFDGTGYCDIGARIKVTFPFGILGSTIGICRFLLAAIGEDRGLDTPERQRRRMVMEGCLGVGMPVVFAALHFVIEPFRYRIIGVTGCQSSFDNSWLTLLLSTIWPPILSLISLLLIGTPLPHSPFKPAR